MVNDELVESKQKRPKNNINGLVDELLVEILCRLPCHKIVVTCKAVCKHWAALLSNSFFIRRFIAYYISSNTRPQLHYYDSSIINGCFDRTFGVVVRKMDSTLTGGGFSNENTHKGLMIRFNDPIYNAKNVGVSSLPWLSTLTVVGASNDLLLYSKYELCLMYFVIDLYIINAQTMQCIELPSLHIQTPARHIGFICDPYYYYCTTSRHTTNLTLNDAYCACIVVILAPGKAISQASFMPTDANEFPARVFSTNKTGGGMWRNVVLSLPLSCRPTHFCSYLSIGRKYYFRCDKGIIGFDPFVVDDNHIIKCDFLPLPLPHMNFLSTFGVFHERLYMCDTDAPYKSHSNGTYRVWALEDYETGSWSLRHTITMQNWISRNRRLDKLIDREKHIGKPISFHPTNPDVIYMISQRWIIMCNLRTKEIEIVAKLPQDFHDLYPDACPFQITLPVWPSPLPTL